MDPVTHALMGVAISKITGNGIALSAPITLSITAGAVLPDADILLQRWGDTVYLKHHRGTSHSIPGMAVMSMVLSAALWGVFGGSFLQFFMWSFIGCLSHVFLDLLNSYGAEVLWPLYRKKIALGLLIVFDPLVLVFLIGYILSGGWAAWAFQGAFGVYLLIRLCMWLGVLRVLKEEFGDGTLCEISVLPSMTGLLRWHFVIGKENCNIVGEKNILHKGVKIIRVLDKLHGEVENLVLHFPVGRFFREFTPLIHVMCERLEGITRYVFIDMRYYMKGKFLHHAVLELDKDNRIVKSTFNPYSINRSNPV